MIKVAQFSVFSLMLSLHSLPAASINLFFFSRCNTDSTCCDHLCPGCGHQIYQQPAGTPDFHGDGLAGHRRAEWSLVQTERSGECPGENSQGLELLTSGSTGKGAC